MLQEPYFFTDNLNLEKAVQSNGGTNPAVLWEIRRQAVQFQEKLQPLHPKIMHISRTLNIIAHNCAHQAKTLPRVSPLCSCNNPAHRASSCPVTVAINKLSPSGTMFLSVQCLWVMKLECWAPYPCSKKEKSSTTGSQISYWTGHQSSWTVLAICRFLHSYLSSERSKRVCTSTRKDMRWGGLLWRHAGMFLQFS
jgi:hypothetical protein